MGYLLKCKSEIGVFRDTETGIFIAPGKTVEFPRLTAEIKRWLQAGGLVQVQPGEVKQPQAPEAKPEVKEEAKPEVKAPKGPKPEAKAEGDSPPSAGGK